MLGAALGSVLAADARRWVGKVDAVVPVPLHWRRRRARGYDQAALLVQAGGQGAWGARAPARPPSGARYAEPSWPAARRAATEHRRRICAVAAARVRSGCFSSTTCGRPGRRSGQPRRLWRRAECRRCTLSCWRLAFSAKPRKVAPCGASSSAARAWWRVRGPSRFKTPSTICESASILGLRRTLSSRTSASTASQIGRRIDERDFVAFDAVRGPDSTVRVVTSRGPSLSIQVPDVRWPERLWVELGPDPRPDFDRDGRHDVVVAIHERERTCLAWAQVDADGYASEVFRPRADWGDSPCVIEIDASWPRLLLEVSVPDSPVPDARVQLPIKANARSWVLDESPLPRAHVGIRRWHVGRRPSKRLKRVATIPRPVAWKRSSRGSSDFAKPNSPC